MTTAHLLAAVFKAVFGAPAGGKIKKGVPIDTSAHSTYSSADRSLTQKFGESYAQKQGSVLRLQPIPKDLPKNIVSDPSPKRPTVPVGTVAKRFNVR